MTKPVLTGRSARVTRRPDNTLSSADLITSSGQIETTSQSSVTQFGMTITFDGSYPVGQFITGDYFVLPNGSTYPTITAVDPAWDGTNGLNGSQLNPIPGSQGLRDVTQAQSATQYTADNFSSSRRATFPVQLAAWDRFWHSIGSATTGGNGSQSWVDRAMVLTCLAEAPPSGSFRPGQISNVNDFVNESEILWDRVPQLTMPSSAPSLATVANNFGRGPWLDWGIQDPGRKRQPFNQMNTYGREISATVSRSVLRICGTETAAEKRDAVINLMQYGIDVYGIVKYSKDNNFTFSSYGTGGMGKWQGALGMGRKLPVWLVAVLTDRQEYKAACAYGKNWWQEDGQVFDVATAQAQGITSYNWQRASGASWAEIAYNNSKTPGNTNYLYLSSQTYPAAYLATKVFNAESVWANSLLSDYADYWVTAKGYTVGTNSTFFYQFIADLYAEYINATPTVPEVT